LWCLDRDTTRYSGEVIHKRNEENGEKGSSFLISLVFFCPGYDIIDLRGSAMPTISRFYGLSIKMYFKGGEHNPPHIHVLYGEYMGAINIKT
jgi:hypothetical protein